MTTLCDESIKILNDVKSFYKKVREYQDKTNYDTQMDITRTDNMKDIHNIVQKNSNAKKLIDFVDQTFMYSINFPPENGMHTGVWKSKRDQPHIREKQIDWLLREHKVMGIDSILPYRKKYLLNAGVFKTDHSEPSL